MKKIFMTVVLAGLLGLAGCGPTALQQAEAAGERLMKVMPPLVMPDDAEALGGGGGGGVGSMGTSQYLRTSLGLQELYDFYSAQLKAADWRLVSEESSESTVISKWEVTDEEGSLIDGTLEVTFGYPDSSDATIDPKLANAYTVSLSLTIR